MTSRDGEKKMILEVVARIGERYRPERIILFGSYAYDRSTEDSDIDLLVVKETADRPIDRRVEVARIISDPGRTVPVEALVMTPAEIRERLRIGDQFIGEIMEKGEVLYGA